MKNLTKKRELTLSKELKKTKAARAPKTKKRSKLNKHTMAPFLAPSIIGVSVFFLLPFLVVIFYSFVDNPVTKEWVWFENFVKLVKNNSFKRAVRNTATFTGIAVPLAVILSLLLAIVLEQKIPGRSQFRTFFLSPMMVPIASVVLIWRVLFDYNGVVNEFISRFGAQPIDWLKSDYALVAIVPLYLWKNLGYNMILFMAALGNVPRDIIEVAQLESANAWQIFWHIKIRYLSPTILFVTIMSIISSFKVFREVYLLTGDHPVASLYMLQHYMNNMFKSLDYQKLSAAAILMSLVMIVLIGALFLIENRFGKDVEE